MKVYIIEGSVSEYEDWAAWIVGVYTSKEKAERLVVTLDIEADRRYKEMLDALLVKYHYLSKKDKKALSVRADADEVQSTLDPQMCFYREPAQYAIEEIELDEGE